MVHQALPEASILPDNPAARYTTVRSRITSAHQHHRGHTVTNSPLVGSGVLLLNLTPDKPRTAAAPPGVRDGAAGRP
jgi:hypothetical protein